MTFTIKSKDFIVILVGIISFSTSVLSIYDTFAIQNGNLLYTYKHVCVVSSLRWYNRISCTQNRSI